MINNKVVQVFSEIADMLEVLGENVFRVRAYRRAAEVIRGLAVDLSEMEDDAIENVSGIGKDLHAKIVEIIESGKCEMHERLTKKLGTGILEILRVRGIGPKKVKLFYEQLDIDSIGKLRGAAESGALAGLPGMGEKSEARILDALDQMTHAQRRSPLKVAMVEAEMYLKWMKKCKGLAKAEVAGSLRRKKATVGDIDILVTGKDAEVMSKWFLDYKKVKQVLAAGETKSSVVIEGDVQVDLRVVTPESWGAALFYFTGPKHFNIDMRTVALKKGWKINEYGVFDGEEKIAGETEAGIFEKLGMDYAEPEERE